MSMLRCNTYSTKVCVHTNAITEMIQVTYHFVNGGMYTLCMWHVTETGLEVHGGSNCLNWGVWETQHEFDLNISFFEPQCHSYFILSGHMYSSTALSQPHTPLLVFIWFYVKLSPNDIWECWWNVAMCKVSISVWE